MSVHELFHTFFFFEITDSFFLDLLNVHGKVYIGCKWRSGSQVVNTIYSHLCNRTVPTLLITPNNVNKKKKVYIWANGLNEMGLLTQSQGLSAQSWASSIPILRKLGGKNGAILFLEFL